MKILKPYDKLYDKKNHKVILKSGRDAGKSTAIYQKATYNLFAFPLDIIMCRANTSDIEKSLFNGMKKHIEDAGLYMFCEFKTRSPGYRIYNKLNGNVVYFEGIGGHDLERTKGLETKNKVSLIIVDETQQLPRKENLEQAWDTFRRHFDEENWQYILAFNPKPQNSHWLNEEYRQLQEDDTWLCLHTSYLDIGDILTDIDKREIYREKKINPSNYRYRYLGETEGLFGGVYHTFDRRYHLVKQKIVNKMIDKYGIHSIIIGVDGATTRDKTAFVPTFILNNGQGVVVDYFYHDPTKNGQMSDDALMPYVERWLSFLHDKYSLSLNQPIRMIFDSASANLRLTFASKFPPRYLCESYSQKNIVQMARIMQNAFGRNVLFILDTGGIFNYVTGVNEYGNHPLVRQLESVIWDEKGKGFDPSVENDVTDALTYSTAFYFRNPEAIYFNRQPDGLYFEREVLEDE